MFQVAELHQDNDSEFTMTLFSDYPAPFVWLTAEGIQGKFSDNGFLMYRPTAIVNFYAWEPVDYTMLLNALRVQSLSDVYTAVWTAVRWGWGWSDMAQVCGRFHPLSSL